jgi:hypothetical protein
MFANTSVTSIDILYSQVINLVCFLSILKPFLDSMLVIWKPKLPTLFAVQTHFVMRLRMSVERDALADSWGREPTP